MDDRERPDALFLKGKVYAALKNNGSLWFSNNDKVVEILLEYGMTLPADQSRLQLSEEEIQKLPSNLATFLKSKTCTTLLDAAETKPLSTVWMVNIFVITLIAWVIWINYFVSFSDGYPSKLLQGFGEWMPVVYENFWVFGLIVPALVISIVTIVYFGWPLLFGLAVLVAVSETRARDFCTGLNVFLKTQFCLPKTLKK